MNKFEQYPGDLRGAGVALPDIVPTKRLTSLSKSNPDLTIDSTYSNGLDFLEALVSRDSKRDVRKSSVSPDRPVPRKNSLTIAEQHAEWYLPINDPLLEINCNDASGKFGESTLLESYEDLYIAEKGDMKIPNSLSNGSMYSAMTDLSSMTNSTNGFNLNSSKNHLNSRSSSDFGAYTSNSNLDTDTFSKTSRCHKWNYSSSISDLTSLNKQVDEAESHKVPLQKLSSSASDIPASFSGAGEDSSGGSSGLPPPRTGRLTCGGRTSYMAWTASLDDEDAEDFIIGCGASFGKGGLIFFLFFCYRVFARFPFKRNVFVFSPFYFTVYNNIFR